jgi:hypothetical protein
VIIEILTITGGLDDSLYADLQMARKARNAWIHGIRTPDNHAGFTSISVAAKLLSAEIGTVINVSGGISVTGF